MLVAVIAEAIAIVLLAVLVLGLLRSHALILNALHELGAGLELETSSSKASASTATATPAPAASQRPDGTSPTGTLVDLEDGVMPSSRPEDPVPHDVVGTTLTGEERHLAVTAPGERTLLAFLSSGCSVCKTFWDEFRDGNTQVPGNGRLAIITQGEETESPSALAKLAGDLEVVQSSGAWTDYDIPGSPYFVYVEDGRITGEGSSTTWTQVRDLMAQAVDDAEARRLSKLAGVGVVGGVSAGVSTLVEEVGRGARDDVSRIDAELLAAGLTKDDPSLYLPPDLASTQLAADEELAFQGHVHDHSHAHGHAHSHDHAHQH